MNREYLENRFIWKRVRSKLGVIVMAEFVLGTGVVTDLREVINKISSHLERTEGIPRRVIAKSRTMEIIADRADYQGNYTEFKFCMSQDNEVCEALLHSVAGHEASCNSSRDNGHVVITCESKSEDDQEFETVMAAISQAAPWPEVWRGQGDKYRVDHISPELLFKAMMQYRASDVHLSPGVSPVFRIDGDTRSSEILEPLSAIQISSLIEEIAPTIYWEEFLKHKQTSFNYHQVGMGYSRVSAFIKSEAPHCTFRFLPEVIPSFEDLNVPEKTMISLAELHRGLLLVTGMTGSGKTTTVAALIDWINSHRATHILTIENPIEYVHTNKKAIISQRNLGSDVETFNDAITGALRHDPDVILIGEMRDSDTIKSAISAAATGHLVISTLHSNTAAEVVNRILSFFDPVERDLVKVQLRDCLKCVICQRLVPKIGGGRVPALELMLNDIKPISDGIKDGYTDLIRIGMQQSVSHSFVFEKYLHNLWKNEIIDLKHARENATDESIFNQMQMGTYSIPRLESIKHDKSSVHGSH